jgi:hypothetical protein
MGVPSYLAGFDSASTMVMATGKALHGEPFEALGNPPALKPLARATRWLPRAVRGKAFVGFGALETLSPRKVGGIDLEEASQWVADSYPSRDYGQVSVGSSSGALVYLNAALGTPWLPQTFLVPVRQRVDPDDPVEALEEGLAPGRTFVDEHPEIQLHHMHDAVQDRQMVRVLTYFRYKRRVLGPTYEQFLRDRLVPGGTILLSECHATWRTTSVGERHVFQHGALGGATEEEFHHGGPRVAEYLEQHGSDRRSWPEPVPDTVSPEAEWGFAPALREDVARFAAEQGFRVRRLVFDHPDALSPLVADLYRWWYARRNIPARRLFVGSFAISAPWWVQRTGSVPYWMFFNEENSLDRLTRYLDQSEPFDDIVLSLFQNGVETVGQPPAEAWREVMDRARRSGRYAGTDLDDFPFDFGQYGQYDRALQELPARYPVPAPLGLGELEEFLSQARDYDGVSWEPLDVRA